MREKSNRKAEFQASPIGGDSFDAHETQLKFEDLGEIFAYYREKHGIRLIRNGDYHKHILQANINGFAAQLDAVTAKTQTYYNFLKICEFSDSAVLKSSTHLSTKELHELYDFLKSEGFLENNRLKKNLNPEQVHEIENFCQKKLSAQAQARLENRRKSLSKDLQSKMRTCCLTKEQAIDEILAIQKSLGEKEMVGYVFTNNERGQGITRQTHWEALIITKHDIIKPLEWRDPPSPKPVLYHTDGGLNSAAFYSPRADFFPDKGVPDQQVNKSHEGVLSVLYLKKLLQTNGKALSEDSLRIPLYDEKNELNYVFIPPPDVMQYAPSNEFIEFYQKLIGKKGETSSGQPTPRDLKELLLESKVRAHLLGDRKTAEYNQNLINKLDAFSEKWMRGCEEACKKRDAMFHNNDKTSYNLYLAYAAKRLKDVVLSRKKERVEPDLTDEKEQEATNVQVNDYQKHSIGAGTSTPQKEDQTQTSMAEKDPKEKFKDDLQNYVFKRMSEAASDDFASHHRTRIITLKFGYSAQQKIAAVNKLIYALDMQGKLDKRPIEMQLTETDIGALTTSRLYRNVIENHLELFNQILENLPERQNSNHLKHDM
ncbi:hypothetical protein OQJ13_00775 [Legionella sp. PATHC035]|uniref:hypothetical protein n=1 Tax=Legionella sp. PATHC035 TaxID=2992040 RepID=UPI002243000B|nr:hypothetical protein [Legionella sp. PATHC035]MCW8407505.1 hypothetical protein [Legionella sp. PATHC035]